MEGWKAEDLIFRKKMKKIFDDYYESKKKKTDLSINMIKIISVLEKELKKMNLGRITPSEEVSQVIAY